MQKKLPILGGADPADGGLFDDGMPLAPRAPDGISSLSPLDSSGVMDAALAGAGSIALSAATAIPGGSDAEITFISGVTASATVASVSFGAWDANNPATYTPPYSYSTKWGSTALSTSGTPGGTVTYWFDAASNWTSTEQNALASGLALWSAEANISFVLASSAASANFTFRRGSNGSAFQTFPNETASVFGSTSEGSPGSGAYISIDTSVGGFGPVGSPFSAYGGYTYETLVHEEGHMLGLGHGGPYNGNVTSSTQQFSAYDTRLWTLMSYINPFDTSAKYYSSYPVTGTFWGISPDGYYYEPTTPMILDILAAQRLYGTPTSGPLASGGQTFGFHSNISGLAGQYFDFTVNTHPVITIWDGGTNNTLDLSGFSAAATISLAPGTFTSANGEVNNIGIAEGTTITNAVGGTGNDTYLAVAGTHTFDGGSGADRIVFTGTRSQYQVQSSNGWVVIADLRSGAPDGSTSARNVESFQFTDSTYTLAALLASASGITVSGTTSEAVQGGPAVALLSGAATISDNVATVASATIKIANGSGAAVSGDRLFVAGVQSGTVSGLSVSWNAATSTLTLTGSASLATYQTVLSQVTYQDTGTDGSSGAHPVRTVTWSVNDGTQTLSTTSTVTVDRVPVATNDTGFDVVGTTLSVAAANGVLANDTDLDGDAPGVTAVNGVAGNVGASVAGTYGRLTLSQNGSYGYVPNGGVAAGSVDSFGYTVADGNGGSASATLRITLDTALVTAPLAILTPTGKATPSTWTLTGSGGSGGLTFGLGSAASHGTAVVNPNGTFTYTPTAGYQGTDSFQYRVTDGLGETSLNTVSVGVGSSGYSIGQSLALSAAQSQYLTRTPSAAGNQATWTWSGWFQADSSGGQTDVLFSATTGSQFATLRLSNGTLQYLEGTSASARALLLSTTPLSASGWHNVVLSYDTTQATAANRVQMYVDGQLLTSFSVQIDPAQGTAGFVNGTMPLYLGRETQYFTGNLADVQFIDGQALNPSALGTLVNGVWQPIAYTGGYGADGYHLTFAAGGIGTDVSGNGNNFTPVNVGNANVSSASPGSTGVQVALTLDNGLMFNGGSSDAISGATVRLTGGFANDGDLLFANTSGTNIGTSWNAASETLTLGGTDTAAHYQSVLDNLVFSSSAADPTNGGVNATRTATWQVTDATNSQLSTPQSETIDISPFYAPTGIAVKGTTSEAIQGGAALSLLSSAPVITDALSATLTGATIKVASGSGAAVSGDRLFVAGVQSGTVSGLSVSWNAATSTLTLTGSASLATYQTVLSQVTYQDTGTDGSSGAHPVRTVTWSVNDGSQTLSATSTVTVDRVPVATNDTGFDVVGTTLSVAAANGVLANDGDLDGDAPGVTTVNGVAGNVGASVAGTYGRLTLSQNGGYSYVPNGGVAAGSVDSFSYTIGDGNGGSASATLRITLDTALVTAPLAIMTPTGKATPSTWTLTGSGGSSGLTFGLGSSAQHGTAVVNPNGTFTYTPTAGYQGTDSFQYRVTDGLGETSLNTVSVGVGSSGYSIAQSLALSAAQSQYLTRTPSVAGNQATWTWSGWFQADSSGGQTDVLFSATTGSQFATLRLSNGTLQYLEGTSASARALLLSTTPLSASGWHNVVLSYDTTQATAANRVQMYVDGQLLTSFSVQIDPAQGTAGFVNGTMPLYLGRETQYFTGNLADVQFIDGQALNPSALGTLVNGVWQPIAYTGGYGADGYHLTFAAGGIGTDVSGNGNNFTPVNVGNANVSSASPGSTGVQVALTLDNGLMFNGGSSDAISGATVRLTGGFANDGDLLFANTSGTNIGTSWNAASETLTLGGTDTAAHYQSVLDNLVFSSSAADPTNGGVNATRTATWQVTDATNSQLSTPQSETIDISPFYAPTGIAVKGTTSEAIQGGAALSLLSSAPVITDALSATLTGATIKVASGSGAAVSGDRLFVAGVQSGTVSGLSVSWNAATSTLTLTGSASLATYQTVLSQVTYQDTGTDGSSGAHPVRTVTWSVNDGSQTLSATSTVTVDRVPVATNDTGFDVVGTTLSVAAANGVLANDGDLDGDAPGVTTVNGVAGNVGASVAGTYGRLTLSQNGGYSYVPNGGVAAGSVDSFSYTIGDGNGGSASATLRITLDTALVTAPLAIMTPTGKATPSTWTLTGSGGSSGLTFGLGSSAQHGTAVVNPNGTFTYTPTAGYQGTDSFQYRVTDGLGETSLNTVSVGVGSSGYSIAQSLALSAAQSQYLTRTPSVAGNQATWTWSGWFQADSSGGQTDVLFSATTGSQFATLRLSNGTLQYLEGTSASARALLLSTTPLSASGWHNVVLSYDTTQATAANRVQMYVDGQLLTSFSVQIDPAQGTAGFVNGTMPLYLGRETQYFTGNLADVQFIDGQALNPSALGTLVNGVWQPIAYTGGYGADGYHLTFAAGGIGTDVSGNGNNFTPVNVGNANVSSASPGSTGVQVALTLDNGLMFNGGSSDAISGATVRLTGGFANDGDLLFANTSGTNIGTSWNAASETLTLGGTDTAAHYQSVLDNLVFSSSAADPTNGGVNATRTATWQVTDATNSQLSTPQSETIDISPVYATGELPLLPASTSPQLAPAGDGSSPVAGASQQPVLALSQTHN